MNLVLQTNDLNRWLGTGINRVHALREASIQAESGKTYAIVGHSGSGKSTLLYLLGLLDRPDSGSIEIDGEPVDKLSDSARTRLRNEKLGFVFQFHFLLKEFSALENVIIPMRKLGRLTKTEMHQQGMSLLDSVGLANKASRLGNQLSGGEQQRVAIARALANNPAIVLADEPTGNLDAKNADMVFDLLSEISHTRGNAFIMVSHNVELSERCDVLLRMQDGRILSDDSTEEEDS